MSDVENISRKYVIQEKHGITPHFYLWEKSDWIDSFKGKILLKEAIEKSKNNKIPFFAMPESQHLQTFVDTVVINSLCGVETIDQLSLYVHAKMNVRSEAFSWDKNTPENLIASKKFLNKILGFDINESPSVLKENYEKWFSELL